MIPTLGREFCSLDGKGFYVERLCRNVIFCVDEGARWGV